jgi:hypothetical protein
VRRSTDAFACARNLVGSNANSKISSPGMSSSQFDAEYDVVVIGAGSRSLIVEQVLPNPRLTADADIAAYSRKVGSTIYHPCGTCRMGEDQQAVVDSDLRVRGIEALRVADASVMPAMPSPNIHPATIMIAEKGSDIIGHSLMH